MDMNQNITFNSNEIAFDKLSQLIEDTQNLLEEFYFNNIETYEQLEDLTNDYFKSYEYKSNIVKGITSTIQFKKLIKNKLDNLKGLYNDFRTQRDKIKISDIIKNDDDYLEFSKKSIINNRILPLIEFIIHEIELCFEDSPISVDDKSSIKWKGNQTELIELIKALIENESIIGKQKDIINSFSKFLNFPINNPDKLITDIKNRSNGNETLFINKLKTTLFNYLTKEKRR